MRGIPVIQIPTTLLAQVDAAVGGKTGVNLVGGKNLIGVFPSTPAVLIDPPWSIRCRNANTAPGLYEVVKHGIIASEPLFRMLADRRDATCWPASPEVVDSMIAESVRIKAEVVSADEREDGLRRILNFGHTFGHALEAETKYKRFLHGEAVAWGMQAATHLASAGRDAGRARCREILSRGGAYGPIPSLNGICVRRHCSPA